MFPFVASALAFLQSDLPEGKRRSSQLPFGARYPNLPFFALLNYIRLFAIPITNKE